MLRELFIKDFAIIKDIEINFTKGLNVLTGETGAGKSILIDAVGLLLGDRADNEMIRTGCECTFIQGCFEIPENNEISSFLNDIGIDVEDDGTLLLSREVSLNGRNKCRINNRTVTLSVFRLFGKKLVEIHGQNSNQSILEEDKQLLLIDSFGGKELLKLKKQVENLYNKINKKNKDLQDLLGYEKNGLREKDLIEFQIQEIDKADLKLNEEDNLIIERKKLEGALELSSGCEKINELLYSDNGCSYDNISKSVDELKNLIQFDNNLQKYMENLTDILYTVEEISRSLRSYKENIENDPDKLEYINKRLDNINNLKRKYGGSIEEILKYRKDSAVALEKIEKSTEKIKAIENELKELNKEYESIAMELSLLRRKTSQKLKNEIEKNLKELAMPDVVFNIKFQKNTNINIFGFDLITFMFSSNPGEDLKPLNKVASGGEISRVMLAIKTILSKIDNINIMIFDEIDTGVSGESIKAVAEKLAKLGHYSQVICVTHSPNIASLANTHFNISKLTEDSRTITMVNKLNKKERISELTRMLGGSKAAEQHAKSLLS